MKVKKPLKVECELGESQQLSFNEMVCLEIKN